jgi:exonuclease SbcC
MLPIKLIIEGLYSYQEPQKIDFTELTAAGLFGIFGSVGSGKSSILEAISYALYGETERLNARDKRTYNMMNLKSNRSYIEFIFLNHENRTFKATREFKRNSKNFEDIKTPLAGLYELKNGTWIPLESTNVEPIIGLSYENFKRTIIIPQGQFKEFLELGEKDRTQMMKEIFNLHQYDLQDKVAILAKQNATTLIELRGQLMGFEAVSEEMIEQHKKNLLELQSNYTQQENLFREISAHFQLLQNLKSDFELLSKKKGEWEKISREKEEIDQLDQKAKTYEKTYHAFYNLLQQFGQIQKELQGKKREVVEQTEIFHQIQKEFQEVQTKITEIQPKYEGLEHSKRSVQELQILLEIHQKKEDVELLKARTQKGLGMVQDLETTHEKFQKEIQSLEVQLEEISKNRVDETVLMEVNEWFLQQKSLLADQVRIQKSQREIQESMAKIDAELVEQGIQPELFYLQSDQALDSWEERKRELEDQHNHLSLQEKISEFSEQLKDGEPCPLCGALDHPHIAQIENVSEERKNLQKELEKLDEVYENWKKIREKVDQAEAKKRFFLEQLDKTNEELNLLKIRMDSHLDNFKWNDFHSDNLEEFEKMRTLQIQRNKAIQELQNQQKDLRTKSEENRLNLEKYKSTLEGFKRDESNKESEINTLKKQINSLDLNALENLNKVDVQNKLETLQKEIHEIETSYLQLQHQFQILSPQLASQETFLKSLQNRIQEMEDILTQNQVEISTQLQTSGLESLETVQSILAQNLDVEAIRIRIQNYIVNRETLKNSIQELEGKLAGKNLNEEEFEAENIKLKEAEKSLKNATEEVAKQTAEIQRLEKEFAQKADLLQQQSALQKREENLKIMTNLFKGAGFVQYVSSIYLRQLCDNANVRFHRMTRNQLSLQLSEKGDFEIIDYLNEGRSRSVKTLSGGQAFQASLSLALALAESVQSQAQADKNFFFIDEGFGTQDNESVNIVFETLTSLQKENRIVGIISHVEELKERIPMALSITKDEELGSLIGKTY